MNPAKAWRERLKRSAPEEYRRQRRDEARRYRARKYAAGLTSEGTPVVRHDIAAERRADAPHPEACPCYDCLFGKPAEYQPTVYHVGVAS